MQSNAFLKSTKLISSFFWCSRHCPMMMRNMTICSVQDHPFLKSACSYIRMGSISPCNHLRGTQQKTSPTTQEQGNTPPVTTVTQVPFLGHFDNNTPCPIHWDLFIVPGDVGTICKFFINIMAML